MLWRILTSLSVFKLVPKPEATALRNSVLTFFINSSPVALTLRREAHMEFYPKFQKVLGYLHMKRDRINVGFIDAECDDITSVLLAIGRGQY
jgi:hypothetical protein